jgi:O-antigen/teichoic acid export membrane protein
MIRTIPKALIVRLGWTTATFGIAQVLRLLNNVVLARLLSPPLFGLMVIVNTIRTGVELLSDLGINQNIVSNPRGETRDFYDTAWTIQVVRGLTLGAFCFATAGAFAAAFERPELATILPVIAMIFIFTGLQSTSRALLQKRMAVIRVSLFELGVLVISIVAHISLALITPTIWALVLGAVIASAASLIASFLLIPGMRHRFVIDPPSAREIIVFGKWIFVASIIYFLAMNFDRLYFAKQISLAELGVYGIARSLADMLSTLVIRSSNLLLFPAVAAMTVSRAEIRSKLLPGRRTMLLAVALGLACFIAVADELIGLLYDARYARAAIILPTLLVGIWFVVLSTVNESIMLGTARPAYPAISNGAKLLTYVVGVPVAFHFYGLMGAILVLNAGEVVRYVILWLLSRRRHLGFGREDLALTIVFVVALVAVRELLQAMGVTGGISALFPMAQPEFWTR